MPSQRRLLFLNISQMGADAPRIPATVKAATQQHSKAPPSTRTRALGDSDESGAYLAEAFAKRSATSLQLTMFQNAVT